MHRLRFRAPTYIHWTTTSFFEKIYSTGFVSPYCWCTWWLSAESAFFFHIHPWWMSSKRLVEENDGLNIFLKKEKFFSDLLIKRHQLVISMFFFCSLYFHFIPCWLYFFFSTILLYFVLNRIESIFYDFCPFFYIRFERISSVEILVVLIRALLWVALFIGRLERRSIFFNWNL